MYRKEYQAPTFQPAANMQQVEYYRAMNDLHLVSDLAMQDFSYDSDVSFGSFLLHHGATFFAEPVYELAVMVPDQNNELTAYSEDAMETIEAMEARQYLMEKRNKSLSNMLLARDEENMALKQKEALQTANMEMLELQQQFAALKLF